MADAEMELEVWRARWRAAASPTVCHGKGYAEGERGRLRVSGRSIYSGSCECLEAH